MFLFSPRKKKKKRNRSAVFSVEAGQEKKNEKSVKELFRASRGYRCRKIETPIFSSFEEEEKEREGRRAAPCSCRAWSLGKHRVYGHRRREGKRPADSPYHHFGWRERQWGLPIWLGSANGKKRKKEMHST